jgi:paired amphipathic helix protein Sin3a
MIESNLAGIRLLEAHLLTIRNLPAEEQQSATLRDDDLDVIHQRAIRKLYGNRTDEILRLVIQRPYFAIPTVLERMKTRHIEWVNCRREWSKIWRQITHQTQQKALDYQAATWKAEEKKTMLAKNILQDLRKKSAAAPRDIYTDPAVLDKLPAHLSFAMPNKKTFADIKKLLWAAVEVNGVKLEKSDLEACWDEFIAPLFGLPVPPCVYLGVSVSSPD